MSKTRKKEIVAPITREQMEAALIAYREASIDEEKINAWRNRAVAKLDAKHAEKMAPVSRCIADAFITLKAWATENPKEFEKTRSIAKPSGTMGFRLGNWSVKPVKGKTLEDVLEFLLTRRNPSPYVRLVPELDKERLLRDRVRLCRRPVYLEKIGVRFAQANTFFADANLLKAAPTTKEAV